jgi:hypothetical protein
MQGIDRVFTSALDAMLAVGCRSEWILRYVWRHCRERMSMICVALQILDLPALVTLQIVDCAVQRADDLCPMAIKWRLITTVKNTFIHLNAEHCIDDLLDDFLVRSQLSVVELDDDDC